jgi:ATP-binding cassette subfamily C (CFTR/MRP) protein 1
VCASYLSCNVLTAGRVDRIVALADSVVVLDGGRVVDVGSPSGLVQRGSEYLEKIGLLASKPSSERDTLDALDINPQKVDNSDGGKQGSVEQPAGTEATEGTKLTDIRRKNGELSVYSYYLASSGYVAVVLYSVFLTLWVFCTEFSSMVIP